MQLYIIYDEKSVVGIIGVGDAETRVLAVELCNFGRRRLAAILADKPHLDARPFLREDLKRDNIRIRVDKHDLRLRTFNQTRDIAHRVKFRLGGQDSVW